MTANISDIIKLLENIAPSRFAEDWDNVGLQLGKREWPVRTVWVALDPLPEVVTAACREKVDLLVTHHPLIFRPIKNLDFDTPMGAILKQATENRLGVFSAHTNLDIATDGINDVLASKIGLKDVKILGDEIKVLPSDALDYQENSLMPVHSGLGLGRIGKLEYPVNLGDFAISVKEKLGLSHAKVAGPLDLIVSKAAVCSGSGSELVGHFFSSDAQAYISGDLRYHDARDAEAQHCGLIDIGHFASEQIILEVLTEQLQVRSTQAGLDVTVKACRLEKDPFMII
jgi:dinuclear metal center YbgI/SA1388 family protein